MGLCGHPDQLTNLAVDALGKYISNLLLQLATFPQYTETPNFKQIYVQHISNLLENELHCKVPASLANEVTLKLLNYINKTYTNVYFSVYRQWGVDVLPSVLTAILHPALTRLEYVENMSHAVECCDFMWDDIFLCIHKYVHKLKKLKELGYGYIRNTKDWQFSIEDVKNIENLEKFSCLKLCNDEILGVLANKCIGLKSLNVSHSHGVTDKSVTSILKFKYLRELNVHNTQISEVGLTNILNGFSHSSVVFRSFKCGYMTTLQMKFLDNNFSNLTTLSLSCGEDQSLSPLKTMKCLRNLSLCYVVFTDEVIDLLKAIGSQLLYLEMYHSFYVKLGIIAESCPALQCFHFSSYSYLECYETFAAAMESCHSSSINVFQFVECLHLEFPEYNIFIEYIVSECKSLKKLHVKIGSRYARQLLETVLLKNQLTHLEQYHWGTGVQIGGDVIVSQSTSNSICISVVDPLERNRVLLRTEDIQITAPF